MPIFSTDPLPDIGEGNCESQGQIVKLLIQKQFSAGVTKNSFVVSTADPAVLASWTAKITATDNTKITKTPKIHDFQNEAGEARTFGGGTVTAGGTSIVLGENPSTFNAKLFSESQDVIEALKKYMKIKNLGVWTVDEFGTIGGLADNVTTPTIYYPIPIEAFFVGSKKFGNYDEADANMISWEVGNNILDKFSIIQPNFNPLLDL